MNTYLWLTMGLVGTQVLYLRVARRLNLVDKPNERSSHTDLTIIRGGGILFYVAALGAVAFGGFEQPFFFVGLTLVALISFLDDLYTLPNRYRLGVQFVAVGLLLMQPGALPGTGWVFVGMLIVGVGILNAYNFMDGINGMTAFYSIVTVGTLGYGLAVQSPTSGASQNDVTTLYTFVSIALLIFTYFNARRRAVCFAGDVGSVSIGFIVLYGLVQTIQQQQTYLPILLLAVYGADSVLTIVHRLLLRQNIFQAHRLHLFQLLVHRAGWPHLRVSALYALIQLGLNGLILQAFAWPWVDQVTLAGAVMGLLTLVYVTVKRRLMRVA